MKETKPKIAVVGLTYPFRGGIAHYSTILARSLRKCYDVIFISFRRQYPKLLFPGVTQYDYSEEAIREENVPVIDSLNPLTWLKAVRKIKGFGANTVIFQWYNPFFAFVVLTICYLLRRHGIKPVIICHNVIPHETSMIDRALTKIAFLACDDFLVHSKKDMANLVALKRDARIVKGYHPTYDVFDFKEIDAAEVKKALDIKEEKVLLFFGYIRKYKGLDVLIKAFAQALQTIDARLVVVGEFYEDKNTYLELMESLRVSEKVTIVDRYVANEEVARYFAVSDAVILPYTSASQSGIVQVAYALRTPVIATDAGGLPDVVIDGVTGYIVKTNDVKSLSDGIMKFYEKREAGKLKDNIEKELDKYSWDALVKTLHQLF